MRRLSVAEIQVVIHDTEFSIRPAAGVNLEKAAVFRVKEEEAVG
jgi:hypothetical protein